MIDSFIDFESQIDERNFADWFTAQPKIQDTLDKLALRKALLLQSYYGFVRTETQGEDRMERDEARLTELNELIPHHEDLLARATSPAVKEQYQSDLSRYKREKKQIEDRLGRKDVSDLIVGKTEFQTNIMYANGLDKLAKSIGEWFASGPLGPGTVTYEGLTFTAG